MSINGRECCCYHDFLARQFSYFVSRIMPLFWRAFEKVRVKHARTHAAELKSEPINEIPYLCLFMRDDFLFNLRNESASFINNISFIGEIADGN